MLRWQLPAPPPRLPTSGSIWAILCYPNRTGQLVRMVTILDGGMGGELIRREVTPRNELWSAQALLDAPDTVLAVHKDYIAAGAERIITNSYSTIPSYLGKMGLEDRFEELTGLAKSLAAALRKIAGAAISEKLIRLLQAGE